MDHTLTVEFTEGLTGPQALLRLAEVFACAGHHRVAHLLRTSSDRLMQRIAPSGVVGEVLAERQAQIAQWGEQDYPSVDPVLTGRPGGCDAVRMGEQYEMPSEVRAKFLCRNAFENGDGTYAHVAVEELAEAICAPTDDLRRGELVQLAAVCLGWIEAIDRRAARESES